MQETLEQAMKLAGWKDKCDCDLHMPCFHTHKNYRNAKQSDRRIICGHCSYFDEEEKLISHKLKFKISLLSYHIGFNEGGICGWMVHDVYVCKNNADHEYYYARHIGKYKLLFNSTAGED